MTRVRTPFEAHSSATFSASLLVEEQFKTTSKPDLENNTADAAPTPLLAPVIKTTLDIAFPCSNHMLNIVKFSQALI